MDGYIRLLEDAGFELVETLDASSEITAILDDVEARLGFLIAAQQLVGLAGTGPLGQALRLIGEVRRLVEQSRLGYWCFIGEKGEKHC